MLLALGASMQPAQAHKPSDSYLVISVPPGGATLEGQWDIALRDLEQAIGLDRDGDGDITWGELRGRAAAVTGYAFARLSVEAIARGERGLCALAPRRLLYDRHVDGGYAVLRFAVTCPFRPAELAVHYRLLFNVDPNHRGLIDVRSDAGSEALVLSDRARTATVSLGTASHLAQFHAFLDEGIWHIWTGYDHILFLLTLLFPSVLCHRAGGWQARDALYEVLKVVTAFTLAHSLTLSLAVNGLIALPSRLVESAIALTVLIGALNNLFPIVQERRWVAAFSFGLIHGLGFAAVLSDLGLNGLRLALALFGFNAGVELGQLAIVLAFVPVAFLLRDTALYRRAFMPIGAILIGVIAAYWLTLRATGLAL